MTVESFIAQLFSKQINPGPCMLDKLVTVMPTSNTQAWLPRAKDLELIHQFFNQFSTSDVHSPNVTL